VKKGYKTTLKGLLKKYEENFKHQASFENMRAAVSRTFKRYFGDKTGNPDQ